MAGGRVIRSLLVALGVKADDAALRKFDDGLGKVKSSMRAVVTVAAVATAAIAGVTISTARAGDNAAKTAKQVNITAEAYQELSFAADRAGASGAAVHAGFRKQARVLEDVRQGSKEYAQSLEAVGLQIADVESMGQDQLFMRIAEGLKGVKNEYQQVALVQDLWGRSGTQLLPLVNDTKISIAELRQEARLYGAVMSEEAANASEEFIDRMTDAKAVMTGFRNTIGMAFMPVFTDLLTGFRDWAVVNRQVIQQRVEVWAESLAVRIREGARVVSDIVDRFGGWAQVIRMTTTALGALLALWTGSKVLQGIVGTIQAASAAFAFLGTTAGGVLVAIVAGALQVVALWGGALLIWDDLLTYLRGGNSAIGAFISKNQDANTLLGQLAMILKTGAENVRVFLVLVKQIPPVLSDMRDTLAEFLGMFNIELPSIGGLLERYLVDKLRVVNGLLKIANMSFQGLGYLAFGADSVKQGMAASQITQQLGMARTVATNSASQAQPAGSSTTNSVSGDVTINGAGISSGEAESLAERILGAKLRSAYAAFEGGGA
jgi:hypothetical protein